ncbi:hypothetical protein LRY65_02815 [Candidatus Woesebacteria bacterium]|nr:hypothetical protein [Candidatus Woesebacteria bacterium]MCD8527122.1 hypothetical protein [Candidatus Woesebacteria bacterium]MCD8546841.1 hypothetical protein [Candidatus Woesebacteria bacterium]
MIWKEIKNHPTDYLILVSGVVVSIGLFLSPYITLATKYLLSLFLGFFYAAWGIWHHRQKKSLSVRVALEYVLMGMLMSLVIWLTLEY